MEDLEKQDAPEGTEESQDEGKSHEPEGNDEEWLEKRGGIQSVRAELKRKTEELAKAKESKKVFSDPEKKPEPQQGAQDYLSILAKNPKGKGAIDHLKSLKLDDKDITAFVEMAELIADAKVAQRTGKFTNKFAKDVLTDNLEALASDKDRGSKFKFVISKYGPEIRQKLKDEGISQEFWDDPKVAEYAVKSVWFDKQDELAGKREEDDDEGVKLSETTPAGGGTGGGVSRSDVEEFARSHGLTVVDTNSYQKARAGLIAMKKAEAAMNHD